MLLNFKHFAAYTKILLKQNLDVLNAGRKSDIISKTVSAHAGAFMIARLD